MSWTRVAIHAVAAVFFALAPASCRAEAWFDEKALNAMLAEADWPDLEKAVTRPDRDVQKTYGWMDKVLNSRGSYVVAELYAREMWRIGQERFPQNCGLCFGAAAVSLFAYAAITIDGQKCQDQTIPQAKLAHLLAANSRIFDYLGQKPDRSKKRAIDAVMLYDRQDGRRAQGRRFRVPGGGV